MSMTSGHLSVEEINAWLSMKPLNLGLKPPPEDKGFKELIEKNKLSCVSERMDEVPLYRRRELGHSYVEECQEEHIRGLQQSKAGGPRHDSECYDPDELSDQSELGDMSSVGDSSTLGPSLGGIDTDTMEGTNNGELMPPSIGTSAQALLSCQVYSQYDFSHYSPKAQVLPVHSHKKEILDKLNMYQVIVLQGMTGCGKSTQVPQYILDHAVKSNKPVNICVTQPRKIAAITLAKRVCDERNWKLGSLVGYQVGLEAMTSEDTRIRYVTTEVLVQQMINTRSMAGYTHIILDEVHERDQHTDFALLLVKKLLHFVDKGAKNWLTSRDGPHRLKSKLSVVNEREEIILMSATIDTSKFAKYFSTPVKGKLIPAPVVSLSKRQMHQTQMFYLEQIVPLFKMDHLMTAENEEPRVSDDMVHLVMELIKKFDNLEGVDAEHELENGKARERGAVLVFAPGLGDIERLITKMRSESVANRWSLLPLHSSITLEEQKEVFKLSPAYDRKIIVSTNIAESSLTVSDVVYVIDLCLTKELHTDTYTNYTCLKPAWCSKTSCEQRAGRVGRTTDGRVYRMVTRNFYMKLRPFAIPELLRCPLSISVLKAKRLDFGEPKSLLALAMDPPNLADICRTVLDLKQIGCMSIKTKSTSSPLDGDLTRLGKVASELPLDPSFSKLIVIGQAMGCLKETIIIAACLSLKSFFSTPFQDELNAHLSKISFSDCSYSDCIAMYTTYELWVNLHGRQAFRDPWQKRRGGIREEIGGGGVSSRGARERPTEVHIDSNISKAERDWARASYVQLHQIREVHKLVEELTDRLKFMKITPCNLQNPPSEHQQLILKLCLAAAFYPRYFKRHHDEDYERMVESELKGNDPYSTLIIGRIPMRGNILYEPQIREMFKAFARDVTISMDHSKAFVKFKRRRGSNEKSGDNVLSNRVPGHFPNAMHMALKMTSVPRMRDTLCLYELRDEDITNQLQALEDNQGLLSDVNSSILDSTLPSLCDESFSTSLGNLSLSTMSIARSVSSYSQVASLVNEIKPPVLPKETDQTWKVVITHVESPEVVWVVNESDDSLQMHHYILNILKLAIDKDDLAPVDENYVLSPNHCPLGEVVLAPFVSGGATHYYRAQIEQIHSKSRSVHVLFVDYGNSVTVAIKELKRVPNELLQIRQLAVECRLKGIKPLSSTKSKGIHQWSTEAVAFAKEKWEEQSFLAMIYSILHGVIRVELYKKVEPQTTLDKVSKSYINYNEELIKRKYAAKSEETLASIMNNKARCKAQSSQSSSLDANKNYLGDSTGNKESLSVSRLLSRSSNTLTTSCLSVNSAGKSSSFMDCVPTKKKIKVQGPYTPLQYKFESVYNSPSGSRVIVETQSVNSTAMDEEPQNPNDQMMVASFVSLSASESSLMVRNTTIMPPIPGILSLCCLTFCPTALLRVTPDCSEYIGALCGLGPETKDTDRPMYPDQDIELKFDISVSNEDLARINKIRFCLASLISTAPGQKDSLDPSSRARRQKVLRNELISLFHDNRAYAKSAEQPAHRLRWRRLNSQLLLSPYDEKTGLTAEYPIYPLHNYVKLQSMTPKEILRRTMELERDNQSMSSSFKNKKPAMHPNAMTFDICYACNRKQLQSLQDTKEHITSNEHRANVSRVMHIVREQEKKNKFTTLVYYD